MSAVPSNSGDCLNSYGDERDWKPARRRRFDYISGRLDQKSGPQPLQRAGAGIADGKSQAPIFLYLWR